MPALSIITINRNNAEGLAKTLESVRKQSFTDYEYIVIDGGSTDKSIDVIKKNSDLLSYWVSEPDRNVYHAMNKGTAQAKGNYCLYLNSGDWLSSSTILADIFSIHFSEDIVYCNDFAAYPDGRTEKRIFPNVLSFKYMYCTSLAHQSTLIKRSLLNSYGGYDERYRLIADWEFFFKSIIIGNVSYKHLPIHVTMFDMSGIGTTATYANERKAEWRAILYQHVPRIIDDYEDLKREQTEYHELKNGSFKWFVRLIIKLKNKKD